MASEAETGALPAKPINGRLANFKAWLRQPGVLCSLPALGLLLLGFAAPLLVVLGYSFMPPRTFDLVLLPTLENYRHIFSESYYQSFLWALFLWALFGHMMALFPATRVFHEYASLQPSRLRIAQSGSAPPGEPGPSRGHQEGARFAGV